MSEIGVLVKVPAELHSAFKRASAQHQRSMQKVLVALLEGWINNGAPDPLSYGAPQKDSKRGGTEDLGARQALVQVAAELKELKQRISDLEQRQETTQEKAMAFNAFYDTLREPASPSARKDDASPFRPLFPPGGLMEQSYASLQRGGQS